MHLTKALPSFERQPAAPIVMTALAATSSLSGQPTQGPAMSVTGGGAGACADAISMLSISRRLIWSNGGRTARRTYNALEALGLLSRSRLHHQAIVGRLRAAGLHKVQTFGLCHDGDFIGRVASDGLDSGGRSQAKRGRT